MRDVVIPVTVSLAIVGCILALVFLLVREGPGTVHVFRGGHIQELRIQSWDAISDGKHRLVLDDGP